MFSNSEPRGVNVEHITSLLEFPIEIIALALLCWTAVEITKLIANRSKETIEAKKALGEKQSSDK